MLVLFDNSCILTVLARSGVIPLCADPLLLIQGNDLLTMLHSRVALFTFR